MMDLEEESRRFIAAVRSRTTHGPDAEDIESLLRQVRREAITATSNEWIGAVRDECPDSLARLLIKVQARLAQQVKS